MKCGVVVLLPLCPVLRVQGRMRAWLVDEISCILRYKHTPDSNPTPVDKQRDFACAGTNAREIMRHATQGDCDQHGRPACTQDTCPVGVNRLPNGQIVQTLPRPILGPVFWLLLEICVSRCRSARAPQWRPTAEPFATYYALSGMLLAAHLVVLMVKVQKVQKWVNPVCFFLPILDTFFETDSI